MDWCSGQVGEGEESEEVASNSRIRTCVVSLVIERRE